MRSTRTARTVMSRFTAHERVRSFSVSEDCAMSTKHIIGSVLVLFATLAIAGAQQPSSSPAPKKSDYNETPAETGEKAGDFTVISSLEFGYRGLTVDGDLNKYQSDLNYKAGPRVFDSSFLL